MTHPFFPGPHTDFCCQSCDRARRNLAGLHPLPDPRLPGGAAYLAVRQQVQAATADGEIDPGRLHGEALAAYQAAESRRARGPDLDQWMTRAAARPGAGGP